MDERLQRILPTVQKPARYTGGEYNEIKKDPESVRVNIAYCFPDTYEIGMSNVGMRILYGVMNEMEGVWCQRVFAPWGDMEQAMKTNDLPLWALESQKSVKDFDMIAFTIGYEMCYTNIVNMLSLSQVPLHASERRGLKNMVFAGGVCAFNPEPLAPFVDFFPWGDMEQAMKTNDLPLWALESQKSVKDFDMIAFTIGYEMCYTNIVNMLSLSQVPLHASERRGLKNMVFAGGVCAFNPEPLAPFVDFFSLGEGEDITVEIVSLYDKAKAEDWTKERFLLEVSKIPGVYVPSFYEHEYNDDGTLKAIVPQNGVPEKITKRIIQNLDEAYWPTKMIVPSTEIVHDRANLEVFRGCIRGCRFCQAGFSCRPVRKKSPEVLYRQAVETLEDSGHNEITLSSLSTSDYRGLKALTDELIPYCHQNNVNLSVPSLRADNFSRELMEKLQTVRKSGLTFAPEAGTQRLRDVINKNLTEDEILNTCANAFSGGWNNVKLYFMLGLPTETDEDVLGIAELVYKIIQTWKAEATNKKRGLRVHVATAYFVPKPHTPFQWEQQITPEEYLRRCKLLKSHFYSKSIEYDYHAPDLSRLEAVFARGDRRLAPVIEEAAKNGAHLDGWDEYFRYDLWLDAFKKCGVDMAHYTTRGFDEAEVLPWDTIDVGVTKKFLRRERKQAYAGLITPDCREGCAGCGANCLLKEIECDA